MISNKITYTYCVTNEFEQLLRFKTWETRLFKMPRLETARLETPRLETGTWITVASELDEIIQLSTEVKKQIAQTQFSTQNVLP